MNSNQDIAQKPAKRGRRLPSADELVRFRQVSLRSHAVLADVADELFPGITERGAAKILGERLLAAGADRHMIEPRVLFGQRGTLPAAGPWQDARPGWSTLDSTASYLLEAVPLLGGLPAPAAIVGGLIGRPEGLGSGERLLREVRAEIPKCITSGGSCRDLAQMVTALGKRRGWRDTSRPRAGWALARRLDRLPGGLSSPQAPWGGALMERSRMGYFGLRRLAPASALACSIWSRDPAAETPVTQGLWMIAARFARGPVGVISRDLLWIDENGPRWLNDCALPMA
ncbi:MAG: hypothetical protein ACI8PQ_002698 [Planctomycetota bacterium]|jgi:hypothetical protein